MWSSLAVLIAALAAYLLGDAHQPVQVDEFYHVLAGRSWLTNGNFAILDGSYTRGAAYTALAGVAFRIFDRSDLLVARLPAILAAALLVPLVFRWMAREATLFGAWLAALALCFSFTALETAQFARFYSSHALFVWLAATAVYFGLGRTGSPDVWKLAAGALCLAIAYHLQDTTIIAALGLGVFIAGDLLSREPVRRWLLDRRMRPWLILVLVGGVLIATVLTLKLGGRFRQTSYWALGTRDDALFYIRHLAYRMPILSGLLPLASLVAFIYRPRATLFCLTMFLIPLALQSFAGMKNIRYIFYTFPFFFSLWGIAAAGVATVSSRALAAAIGRRTAPGGRWRSPGLAPAAATAALSALAAVVVVTSTEFTHSARDLVQDARASFRNPASITGEPPDSPWTDNAAQLRAAIGAPSLFVTAEDLHTMYYLGSFDLLLNRSRISDLKPPVDFGRDFRTGRRVVGSGERLIAVARCYPDGIVLIPDDRWRIWWAVPNDAANAIEAFATPVRPGVPGFHLYRWRHEVSDPACARIVSEVKGHAG